MKHIEYGSKDGQLVVYFHGVPGAIEECTAFEAYAKQYNLHIICFDRFSIDSNTSREDYYQQLASEMKTQANGKKVAVIGFSIGAHVALEVCARLDEQVRQLNLVSAAAPIGSGDFLAAMAGGAVFKLAIHKPFLFYCLSYFQKLLALVAPTLLFNMLFASAAGKDKALSKQSEFKAYIIPLLKQSFTKGLHGYIRDIRSYTSWQSKLSELNTKVCIWHGTQDNWSPFTMPMALNECLAGAEGVEGVEAMEGLSHYSCLFEAAPNICAQIESATD